MVGNDNDGITVIGIHTSSYVMRCSRLPTPGEYIIAGKYERSLDGGKASNQALAAARLGGCPYLVCRLGDDDEGRFAYDYLSKNGVNMEYTTISKTLPTGFGIAFMDENGVPMGATHLGCSEEFAKEYIDCAIPAFKKSKILLVQLEIPVELAMYACKLGKRHNLTTILNPAPADGLDVTQMSHVDILTPNEPEARILAGYNPDDGIDIVELGKRLYKTAGVKHLIITCGKHGALIINDEGILHKPCPAVKSVDTSGAGDCFNSALAFALANGVLMEKAVEFGVKTASLSVTKLQVWPSYPTMGEIEKIYGKLTLVDEGERK